MNSLIRINKQIELFEDAILLHRWYVDGVQTYSQERIKREVEHMKQRRDKIRSRIISEFKYLR